MKGSGVIYDYNYCELIAKVAHFGQHRKFGDESEYIVHPIAVASKFNDPRMKCIAVMHDVIEDSNFTTDMLHRLGIPGDVIQIVDILSRRDGEKYFDYIDRVLENRLAMEVKVEDVKHNMKTAPRSMVEKRYKPTLDKIFNRMIATGQVGGVF